MFDPKDADDGVVRPPRRYYRAITRRTDGCIIHVRDIEAHSDQEAIQIVIARGSDIRTDLWSEHGLVRRFGVQAG